MELTKEELKELFPLLGEMKAVYRLLQKQKPQRESIVSDFQREREMHGDTGDFSVTLFSHTFCPL